MIDEPSGEINDFAQDSILTNLKDFGRIKAFTQSINSTYKLPFDKFPLTDWLGSDVKYAADYTWNAGPEGLFQLDSLGEETDIPLNIGNNIQNTQNMSLNGKIDLNKIYKKFGFLRRINTLKDGKKLSKKDDPLEIKRKRLRDKLAIINYRLQQREKREKEKEEKLAERLSDKVLDKIIEDAKSDEKVGTTEVANDKEDDGKVEILEEEEILDTTQLEHKKYRLEDSLKAVEDEIAERKKQKKEVEAPSKLVVASVGTLMSIKNINISLSRNSVTNLPGFTPVPKFMGFDESWDAPGLAFLLGSQNPNILDKAQANGWLAQTDLQNQPFLQTRQNQISIKTDLEPIKDFKITLEASQSNNYSYSEQRRWDEDKGIFETQAATRTGGFTQTIFAIPTAFGSSRSDNSSSTFEEFEDNLLIVKERLDNSLADTLIGRGVRFDTTSQDVLVPAFLAAYLGKDANSIDLTPVRKSIPIPAWRITYNGLAKIPALKEKFKSISITHGYKAEYSTGSYTSSLKYVDGSDGIDFSDFDEGEIPYGQYLTDENFRGNLVPVPILVYNDVSISENFSPLIGINIRTKKDISIKLDYNKGRQVGLSLANSQVTEQKNNNITMDVGFIKKEMKLPFNGKTLKNDVTFRMAFSLTDTKTTQHRIGENSIVTQGNLQWQLRPTISYEINKRTQFQFYFERTVNDPKVSNQFKRTTTAFGAQLRFNLAQ